jgi:hypothetical protein
MADLKISALTASTTPLAGTEVLPIVQSSTTKQVSVANLTAGRAVSALSYSSTTGANFATSSGNVGVGTASPVTLKSQQTFQTLGNAKLGATNGSGLLSLGDTASPNANAGVWRGAAGAYGSDGNYLCLGGYDGITFTTGNSDISTQTKQLTIDTSGNATLATGNLVIGTSGKGIDFSATPGTGTSELLADYEEGTFTITISGSTSGSGTVAGVANYIKVGKVVTINVAISNVTFPTYAGNLQIGLPYAAKSDADGQLFGAPMYFFPLANWTTGVLFAGWIPRVGAGDSVITFSTSTS